MCAERAVREETNRITGRQEQVAGVLARIFINKNVVERFLGEQQAGEEKLRKWTSKEQQRKKKEQNKEEKGIEAGNKRKKDLDVAIQDVATTQCRWPCVCAARKSMEN